MPTPDLHYCLEVISIHDEIKLCGHRKNLHTGWMIPSRMGEHYLSSAFLISEKTVQIGNHVKKNPSTCFVGGRSSTYWGIIYDYSFWRPEFCSDTIMGNIAKFHPGKHDRSDWIWLCGPQPDGKLQNNPAKSVKCNLGRSCQRGA